MYNKQGNLIVDYIYKTSFKIQGFFKNSFFFVVFRQTVSSDWFMSENRQNNRINI